MPLSPELESVLRERLAQHVRHEVQRDVKSLYEFIDPDIRESRAARFDIEPEHTMTQIREYTSHIHSAELVEFGIESYSDQGGDDRGNVPTALVLSSVRYNEQAVPKQYRTPWVLRSGQWYTRAVGKIPPLGKR